jgi:hypothetical protein
MATFPKKRLKSAKFVMNCSFILLIMRVLKNSLIFFLKNAFRIKILCIFAKIIN